MKRPGHPYSWLLYCSVIAFLTSGATGTRAGYLYVKAHVAQVLLNNAWQETLDEQNPVKPWSWADTTTAARLSYTLSDSDKPSSVIVLDNASGEAMAFGPGHVAGELNNASQATVALGGHRDTHLAFLEFADAQTHFQLQVPSGQTLHYRFEDAFVVDSEKQQLQIATDAPGLVLITCYPFNALQTGGPLRIVVRATLIDTDVTTASLVY